MKTSTSFKKGHKGYWLGKKMPEYIGKKMSASRTGSLNYKYKGEESAKKKIDKYWELHRYIESQLGKPKQCSHCKTKRKTQYDWCNISHKYKRDLSDWRRLCASCHQKYDLGKIKL